MSTPFSALVIDTTLPPSIIGRQSDVLLRQMALAVFATYCPTFDISEGSDAWVLLSPFAIVLAEAYGDLVEVERRTSLATATGTSLDLLGELYGVPRGPAAFANGYVVISGRAGSDVPLGTTVSTEGPNAQFYQTTLHGVIPSEGAVTLPVIALATGSAGNVPPGTVVLFGLPVPTGLTAVTNTTVFTGGADIQQDGPTGQYIEGYRGDIWRLMDARGEGGAAKHLRKWARAVPGVGSVVVEEVTPRPGWVTISLLGIDGKPASPDICKAVESFMLDPWYLTYEAEEMDGSGTALSTQPDGTPAGGTNNTVQMPNGSSVIHTAVQAVIPQPGIWRLIPRLKGNGTVQFGVWDTTNGAWANTRPQAQGVDAVQTYNVANANFLEPIVDVWQDFAYEGHDTFETRITCMAGTVYLDLVNYWATMSRSDRDIGLTPAGMRIWVKPAGGIVINVAAALTYQLSSGMTQESVQEAVAESIAALFASLAFQSENDIRRASVEVAVMGTAGIADVQNLTLNGAAQNIAVGPSEVATLGTTTWT